MTPRAGILIPLCLTAEAVRAATVISGIEGDLLENVREFVDEPDCDATTAAVRRYVRDLPEDIRPALEALGHYEARVSARRAAGTADCWNVELEIDARQPVAMRDVSIELTGSAGDDEQIRALVAEFPLPAGSTLHHGRY
jgi:hypothetical protein